jgi:hypothetical protein
VWDEDFANKDDFIGITELGDILPFKNNKKEIEIEINDKNTEDGEPKGKLKIEILYEVEITEKEIQEKDIQKIENEKGIKEENDKNENKNKEKDDEEEMKIKMIENKNENQVINENEIIIKNEPESYENQNIINDVKIKQIAPIKKLASVLRVNILTCNVC